MLVCALICAKGVCGAAAQDEPRAGLTAQRLHIPANGSMLVRIQPPAATGGSDQSLHLAWMDADGALLHTQPVRVRPGVMDLVEHLPEIRRHREVSYVQLLANDQPVGAAMTIQPMLSRVVPMTVEGYRPDGTTYPRVVGWRTEQELAAMARRAEERADEQDEEGEESDEADGESSQGDELPQPIDRGRPAEEALADPSRVLSGFRLFVEQDVVLETSLGDIRIALRPDHAPNTVWSFRELVRTGFYDGLRFHRIVPLTAAGDPFLIQAGDPSGTGAGGAGLWVPLEPSRFAHDFGVVSLARGEHPDSGGSQFFISLSREGTRHLDGQYCAFGYAVEGGETIKAIASTPLRDIRRGEPETPVVIHAALLIAAPPRSPGHGRPDARVSPHRTMQEPTPRRVPR